MGGKMDGWIPKRFKQMAATNNKKTPEYEMTVK